MFRLEPNYQLLHTAQMNRNSFYSVQPLGTLIEFITIANGRDRRAIKIWLFKAHYKERGWRISLSIGHKVLVT